MENYFPFHNVNELENMMINIQAEGVDNMLKFIETEKNAIRRFKERNLYYRALKKLEKEK